MQSIRAQKYFTKINLHGVSLSGNNEGPHSQFCVAGGEQQAPPAGGEHLHWEEGEGGLQ